MFHFSQLFTYLSQPKCKFSCTDVYNITLAFIVQAEDKSQLIANKLPIVRPATLFFLGSKNVHWMIAVN